MSRLDDLIQRQHETWTRMNDILSAAESENRDLSAEERTNYDAAEADLDRLDGDIRRVQKHTERGTVDRSQIIGGGTDPDEGDTGSGDKDAQARKAAYREAFEAYVRSQDNSEMSIEHRRVLAQARQEHRAQGVAVDTAGGHLVPDEFLPQLSETLKAFGGMLQYCNVITTSTGADLSWPTVDDTGNIGQLLAENTQVAEQDVTFGERTLGAYKYTSKMIRVSWELLQDEAFGLPGYLVNAMGQRIGRIWAQHLVAGTGVSQPEGVLTNATVAVTSPAGANQTITLDNLIDLEHSIDPAYRALGNTRYGLADGALKILRKLKDADGRPIWQPIPAPGFPATINGQPYFVDNSLTAPAAGGKSVIFGDFKAGMIVRQVQGVQMVRLVERYADFLQTAWFGYARMDAKPDDPNALAALRFGAAA